LKEKKIDICVCDANSAVGFIIMAWLAAATNNDDLVEQLVENGILTNEPLRRAFALTDRGDFVQANFR
jgi:hypothetical protein